MNSLHILPKDLEDIIIDYKYQLEHSEKMKKICKEINSIEYEILFDNNIHDNSMHVYHKYVHVFSFRFDKKRNDHIRCSNSLKCSSFNKLECNELEILSKDIWISIGKKVTSCKLIR